jgi:predicted transcriptional regulator
MNQNHLWKSNKRIEKDSKQGATYPRPAWVPKTVSSEEELCPDCFKVVGEQNRYKLVCLLGKEPKGLSVTALTKHLNLKQPTVTHHLQVLKSVDAVQSEKCGRECIYQLNREAHCFEECKIPYDTSK